MQPFLEILFTIALYTVKRFVLYTSSYTPLSIRGNVNLDKTTYNHKYFVVELFEKKKYI